MQEINIILILYAGNLLKIELKVCNQEYILKIKTSDMKAYQIYLLI